MLSDSYHTIPLKNGQLELVIEPSVYSLSLLLDFASRENPNRAYLFLSKVLGKYIPCLPSEMRKTYKDLANMITVTGNTLVLGVAETATGLGAGVAQEINANCGGKTFYTQTTRYRFDDVLAYSINEKHSHAPQHLIYDMADNVDLPSIENIILVDDEISTGNTLAQITRCMIDYLPNLKTVQWASLVNWMPEINCTQLLEDNANVDLSFHSLLRGGFNYNRTTEHVVEFPKSIAMGLSPAVCRRDIGRKGVNVDTLKQMLFINPKNRPFTAADLNIDEQYVLVGTSEFTFAPFLFAEMLEKDGYDVLFESTGRSPILQGGGISSKLKFYDPIHEANYYLYNLPEDRTPIIMYETIQQYEMCPLHKLLNCKAAILGEYQ
ncbi:MAG: adenine/guanine phosphoribosyltransferase-like PRPP-binding protein [Cellvibrionaceae bacterium]|jgi:adenine/guanine phosphoribosyltransferase-like PRPP-binding protein